MEKQSHLSKAVCFDSAVQGVKSLEAQSWRAFLNYAAQHMFANKVIVVRKGADWIVNEKPCERGNLTCLEAKSGQIWSSKLFVYNTNAVVGRSFYSMFTRTLRRFSTSTARSIVQQKCWLAFKGEMSRYYRTGTDPGLSRQSSKSYKVVRQKSNAELNEKLRRLDIEHHSTISKILTERYTWRTIHYNLTHPSEESSSESDEENRSEETTLCTVVGAEEEHQNAEKKVQAALVDSTKKQGFLQLPSIIEESTAISKQRCSKFGRSPLPPLSEHGFPTRVRRASESNHEKETTTRQRQRSSTLPIGHMPGDRQRKSEFKKVPKHEKLTNNDGKRVGDEKSGHNRTSDDNEPKKPTLSWGEELHGCRYLRNKRHSSPGVLDTDVTFDSLTSDKWVKIPQKLWRLAE